jgi:hypothetical protein
MKYDKESSSIEEKLGSYYFFIPQVTTLTFSLASQECFLSTFLQYKLNVEVILYSDRGNLTVSKFCVISVSFT